MFHDCTWNKHVEAEVAAPSSWSERGFSVICVLNDVTEKNTMSDFDCLQFLLQLSHVDLLLFDPVQDLLLRPRYLFLMTQVNTRRCHFDWLKICERISNDNAPPLHLFAQSLSLHRDRLVCSMFLQDTNGTDTALTRPAVHLDR